MSSLEGSITVTDLAVAREIAHRFPAIITLEDPGQEQGFRLGTHSDSRQLVLQFADLAAPEPGRHLATERDLETLLAFARSHHGALLIHCNHGLSRSPGVAIAVLADRLGPGREGEVVKAVLRLRPGAIPNGHVVAVADAVLGRAGMLRKAVSDAIPYWRALAQEGSLTEPRHSRGVLGTDRIGARVSQLVLGPLPAIFGFFADATNDPLWIPQIVRSHRLDTGPLGVGSHFEQMVVGPLGQATVVWKISDLAPDREIRARSVAGDYRFAGGYLFEPQARGVLVTKFAEFERSAMLRAVPRAMGDILMGQLFRSCLNTAARRAWQ